MSLSRRRSKLTCSSCRLTGVVMIVYVVTGSNSPLYLTTANEHQTRLAEREEKGSHSLASIPQPRCKDDGSLFLSRPTKQKKERKRDCTESHQLVIGSFDEMWHFVVRALLLHPLVEPLRDDDATFRILRTPPRRPPFQNRLDLGVDRRRRVRLRRFRPVRSASEGAVLNFRSADHRTVQGHSHESPSQDRQFK